MRSEAGFTLLEMLVVIVLTAAFMSIVIMQTLNSQHITGQSTDIAARFSEWLDQQQGNSIYAAEPQRMCFEPHQITVQHFDKGHWQASQARFTLPDKADVTSVSSQLQQDNAIVCFLLAFNTLLPAGHVTFGPAPRVTVAWGSAQVSGNAQ